MYECYGRFFYVGRGDRTGEGGEREKEEKDKEGKDEM